jgi:hypothetical protein
MLVAMLKNENHSDSAAAVVQGAVQPSFGEVHIRQRGRLPHWEKDSGLYFTTFHLADSLPQPVLEKILERRRLMSAAKQAGAHLLPSQKVLIANYSARRMEEYFDRGAGACFLSDARIGGLAGSQNLSTASEEALQIKRNLHHDWQSLPPRSQKFAVYAHPVAARERALRIAYPKIPQTYRRAATGRNPHFAHRISHLESTQSTGTG